MRLNIPFKTYYIEQDNQMRSTHTFLVYTKNNKFYYFENSYEKYRGIYEYHDLNTLLKDIIKHMMDDQRSNGFKIYEYNKPKYGIGVQEFMDYCRKGNEVKI